jgi:hypothetical protein
MKNNILVILHLQNIIIYINEINKNNHDPFLKMIIDSVSNA